MMIFSQKLPACVVIRRPDGTENRFVRRKKKKEDTNIDADNMKRDEDREAVLACPLYTASFNALLKEHRDRNSRAVVNAVLERMYTESIPMNVTTYNLLMERVVSAPDDLIFVLYEKIKEESLKENSSVQPNLTTYQLLFRACERKADYKRAFLFYQQLRQYMHIKLDSPTFDTLLGFCAAIRDVAQASYFMEDMRKCGVLPNANSYNCLMSVLVDAAPYEETLRVFQEMTDEGIRPTVRTYNILIKATQIYGDYDRAFQFFEEMKKSGMLPDVVTYNTLLCLAEHRLDYIEGRCARVQVRFTLEQKANGRRAIAELALTLLNEMRSIGVEENTFTFNQVMKVLLLCRDRRIFSLYVEMQERYKREKKHLELQLKREARRRQSLLSMKSLEISDKNERANKKDTNNDNGIQNESNDPASTFSLNEMLGMEDARRPARIEAQLSQPNVDTYRIIIQACLSFGHANLSDHFYTEMLRVGLLPDHDFIILMLNVCESLKDPKRAYVLVTEAKKMHFPIDTSLYNAYLNVLALLGDTTLIHTFERMQLGVDPFCVTPNVETYNIMLRGYFCMERYDDVVKLFSSMYIAYCEVKPDANTYIWVLRAYSQTHNTDAASQLLNSMQQRKIPVRIQHYNELMQVYLEADNSGILDIFDGLQNTKDDSLPNMDANTFCVVMQYYLRHQRWEELKKVFNTLKTNHEIDINIECYNVVLRMYLAEAKCTEAKQLFNELRMRCLKPNLTTYELLLRIFASAGNAAMYDVLEDMKANYVLPDPSTLGILMEYAEGRDILTNAINRGLFANPEDYLQGLCSVTV